MAFFVCVQVVGEWNNIRSDQRHQYLIDGYPTITFEIMLFTLLLTMFSITVYDSFHQIPF